MRPEPIRATDHHPVERYYDEPYTYGRLAATYLSMREIARLMVLRSKLADRPSVAGVPRD